MSATKTSRRRSRTVHDESAREAKRQETQRKIAELHDRLTAKVEEILTTGDWEGWLKVAAKFHAYSFNNVMLILIQRPDATAVAGYRRWQEMGRQVKKGERAIKIFAPTSRKRYVDDPTVPGVKQDKDGKLYLPYTGFVLVPVFDISQTEGDDIDLVPRPRPRVKAELLTGDGENAVWTAVERTLINDGYTVEFVDLGRTNGQVTYKTKRVEIHKDRSGLQQLKTLIHERAHTLLHKDVDYLADRGRWEVEAESVAYIVMGAMGMDSARYSFGYVAGWSNGDTNIVRDTAERVMRTAQSIIEQISAGA